MKLLYFCLFLLVSSAAGLVCWECENVRSQAECLVRGQMRTCRPEQTACQLSLRHGGWGKYPLIEKACKQLAACGNNHFQDAQPASVYLVEDHQCTREPPSSVCRCCCHTDMCNRDLLDCPLGGLPCEALLAPENGEMKCLGGNNPQSICRFKCKRGFNMIGSPVSRCDIFSKRDFPAPTCEKVEFTCDRLRNPQNGRVICPSNFMYHGIQCTYSCDSGHELIGASVVTCLEDQDGDEFGTWSRLPPVCLAPRCNSQSIANGQVRCSNSFFVGTTCNFFCNGAYRLFPSAHSGSNMCQQDENWNRQPPCCRLPCPPNARMDFVVILDSSSSVGAENFNRTKTFIKNFLSAFTISDSATHVAIFRYNRNVDNITEIRLQDYPNSFDNLVQGIDRIPYGGSGTRTGNAINYTVSEILTDGNRPGFRSVVLLITDGASQDDITLPSLRLRQTNAVVFVLPITPPSGRQIDLEEVSFIAGGRDNVITDALTGGFDALNQEFSRRISSLLCDIPCHAGGN